MTVAYRNDLQARADKARGVVTTHQGGQAYKVDNFTRLRRFLVFGSEGGSFYVNESKFTTENVDGVLAALAEDGHRAVNTIVEFSEQNRIPKNEVALLALALAAAYKDSERPQYAASVRTYALQNLPRVARIGTHKFIFAEYINSLRGWGSGLRKAVARLYTDIDAKSLAYDVTKYPQRKVGEGGPSWSHRDLLRLSHPVPPTPDHDLVFKYVTQGLPDGEYRRDGGAADYLCAVERIKRFDVSNIEEAVFLIEKYNLPREVIPTELLREAKVWEALLYAGKGMPMTAMLRNLGNMSKVGLLSNLSDASRFVVQRLGDVEAIRRSRIHPIDVIKAHLVYSAGRGQRGDGEWTPVQTVVRALDGAFYASFGNVQPTGKRLMIALDVSGSMTFGDIGGIMGFTPRVASAVMAMVTMRTEQDYVLTAFTHGITYLKNIGPQDSLDSIVKKIDNMPFGATDCSLPMRFAEQNRLPVDAFLVYTDSETGYSNPSDALRRFRRTSGIRDSKLVVVGMLANQFSIADPADPNMLDVVGFDSAAPAVISEFVAGRV